MNILGASEINANIYCNCVHLYWEGCVISSLYLQLMKRSVHQKLIKWTNRYAKAYFLKNRFFRWSCFFINFAGVADQNPDPYYQKALIWIRIYQRMWSGSSAKITLNFTLNNCWCCFSRTDPGFYFCGSDPDLIKLHPDPQHCFVRCKEDEYIA